MRSCAAILFSIASCTAIFFLYSVVSLSAGPLIRPGLSQSQPIDVVKAYLQAHYARDPRRAYRLISAIDRSIRDEKTYVGSQEGFDGFALELARQLAAALEVQIADQVKKIDRATLEVVYRVPTGDELSPQLLDWNGRKLNALPPNAQKRLADALEELKQSGKMVTLEGRQTFELVREKSGWKIFLDWASRTRVIFKSVVPRAQELEVRFIHHDFLVEMNEPFQVDFALKNRSARPIVAQLNHLIEPRRLARNVEMIACGSLAPVRLEPGEVREISSSYILGGVPAKSRVSIVYEFTVRPEKGGKKILSGFATSP